MADQEPGWRAYSPQDPDLPDDLRRLHDEASPPVPLGEVHVRILGLEPGQSEVRVQPHATEAAQAGLSEVKLIDAAIAELRLARRVFSNEGDG